jgi:hypothetical protein
MIRRTELVVIAFVAAFCGVILYLSLGIPHGERETMETRRIGVDYVSVQIPGELWDRIVAVSSRMEISPEGMIREALRDECHYQEMQDSIGWSD